MTSATERLRALLTEHGVEWGFGRVERRYTAWVASGWHMSAKELADGSLLLQAHSVAHFTPEQAVAATLGRGTCHAVFEVDAMSEDDRIGEFVCSECGETFGDGHDQRPNYCPACGRKVVE